MRILLTGSKGFIGTHLHSSLNTDHEVVAYDIKDRDTFSDLIREVYLGGFDVILHFGANANAQAQTMDELLQANIEMSLELLNASFISGTKFIFASSLAVNGISVNSPLSPYATSKLVVERAISDYKLKDSSWQAICLRLSNITGPGEAHKKSMMSVPYVFLREAISRGAIEVWSKNVAGKSVIAERDFLDVRDLVSIVTRLMTKNFPEYHIVEIGSGKSYSFLEIAQRVSSLVTCKVSVVDLPNYVRPEFYQTSTISNLNTLQYILGGIEFFELDSTIAYIKEKEVNFLE